MIYAIVGRPGMGKTYTLTHIAWKAITKNKNVYSNFYIDFSKRISKKKKQRENIIEFLKALGIYSGLIAKIIPPRSFGDLLFWKRLDEFVFLRDGIILMDEAQIYMNAREFMKLPDNVQYKFQQHRKHGLDLYLAVQNVKRIDIIARELVNSVFELRKIKKLFIMTEYDIEDVDKTTRKSYSIKPFFFRKWIAQSFDTFQEIRKF